MTGEEQKQLDNFRKTIDFSSFDNTGVVRRVEKPWGYELILTPEDSPYVMKIEHVNAGCRLSLQVHDEKQESWVKLSGDAILVTENESGEMEEIVLEDRQGYHLKLGQKHRLKAGETDAEFLECSTPELGNTFRLEDDYNRSTETEEMRSQPDRGWQE